MDAVKVREWIAQGRAGANTLLSLDGGPWRPLSSFPEFADDLRTAVPPAIAGQPAYAAPGYPAAERNNLAIAGLVLSILGLVCCCGPLGSLVGIILSAIGLSQINKEPQRYSTSTAIAWAGIVVGILGIVAAIVLYSTGAMDQMMEELQRRRQ